MLGKISKAVRKKVVAGVSLAGVSLIIAGILLWNYTDQVFAKENMVPGYEVKLRLDNEKSLNAEKELNSNYKEIFDTGEIYETIGVEYLDTDQLDFNEEGWINRIRIKEGKSDFELTYKKRYSITNGDIEAALTQANEEGFDMDDDNYKAEIDWGYQKMTLSITRIKKASNSEYDDLELPGQKETIDLITDKMPGKLEDWKVKKWGTDTMENARIYGPVYYKKYKGEINGIDVAIEIWPIMNQTTQTIEYITELSFKDDSFQRVSPKRKFLLQILDEKGILLHEDSLKTQNILAAY